MNACYKQMQLKLDLEQNFDLQKYCISLAIRQCFISFLINPKNLDPSYKMDLDLWDCLGRVTLIL